MTTVKPFDAAVKFLGALLKGQMVKIPGLRKPRKVNAVTLLSIAGGTRKGEPVVTVFYDDGSHEFGIGEGLEVLED